MVVLHAFLSSAVFQNRSFSKKSFRNTIWVSNRLDSDQARRFVRPDLGPICLQRLSADDTRRQKIDTKRGGSLAVCTVNMCKLTPKRWKLSGTTFLLKQLVANISPVINVKAFIPVIVVVILQIDTIE